MNGWVRPLVVPVLVAFTLCGCGSCQRAGETASTMPTAAPTAAPTPAPAVDAPVAPADLLEDCFVFVDAEPDYGNAPLKTHFSTEVECGDKPVTYSWNFGDGTTGGNEPNPSHSYTKVGDYVATVTVTATDGSTGSDEIDVFVEAPNED